MDQTEEKRNLEDLQAQLPSPPVENTLEAKTSPDGGLVAYMQVTGSFLVMFNAWYVDNLSHILTMNINSDNCSYLQGPRQLLWRFPNILFKHADAK